MTSSRSDRAALCVALCLPLTAGAQSAAQAATAAPTASTLPPVVVTGNPLANDGVATPGTVLTGPALVLKRGSSLGETLAGEPGVSSSYFGPNANRPVIRGQDGDRIRILSNAGASLDASGLSFDHAVPMDPLVVERLEVLRGPAALLYGGGAIGGVVNAIDNRIPKAPIDGMDGAIELRGGGAARERSASGLIEAGAGRGLQLHADAFGRRTDDLRVPAFDRPLAGVGSERRERIANSASDASGGALGTSYAWEGGYVGVAVDSYRNDYGIVAEDDVTIRMRRDKLALAGQWRMPDGPVRRVSTRLQASAYRHEEVEGDGTVGTRFANRGGDGRIEIEHAPWAGLRGVFGLQMERARFSALGEEAFVPSTRSSQQALFAHEELTLGEGNSRLSFGARVERHRIDSAGDDAAADAARFGPPQSRRFGARSAAAGVVWDLGAVLGPGWQSSANLAYTERAPTGYELFADGAHIATAAFERGDPDLGKERGRQLDIGLQWTAGHDHLRIGAFVGRYANYITLLRTGEPDVVGDSGEPLPVYAYRGVRAALSGIELEGARRLLDGRHSLELEAKLDAVRGSNRDVGQPLPRIAPLRLQLAAVWGIEGWSLRGEVVRARRQDRVPADDAPTPGYTMVNLALSKRLSLDDTDALAFVKLGNVGNALAYNAASIATVRPLAPLPGRSLGAGLRVSF